MWLKITFDPTQDGNTYDYRIDKTGRRYRYGKPHKGQWIVFDKDIMGQQYSRPFPRDAIKFVADTADKCHAFIRASEGLTDPMRV